jgi:hypothetical protein
LKIFFLKNLILKADTLSFYNSLRIRVLKDLSTILRESVIKVKNPYLKPAFLLTYKKYWVAVGVPLEQFCFD